MRLILLFLATIFISCIKHDHKKEVLIHVSKEKNLHIIFPSEINDPSSQYSKSQFIIEKITKNRVVVKYNPAFNDQLVVDQYVLRDTKGTNYVLRPELVQVKEQKISVLKVQ